MSARRDPIFWAATAIFAVSVLLAAKFGQGALLLGVAAYLLRPTVHALGFARRLVDERQLQIQYRSSHVAFSVMTVGLVAIIVTLMQRGDHTWEMLVSLLICSLAARAISGLMMVGDPLVTGRRIIFAVGGFLALFGAMEGFSGDLSGLPAHVLPGAAVIALGWYAPKARRLVGSTMVLIAAALVALIAAKAVQRPDGFNWGSMVAIGVLTVPLIVAGVSLLRSANADGGDELEAA